MDLSTVDLNLLVVFEAMMQERNVSRAAKRLGLAQPSMSNAVKRLRELFNDELFVRTPREMRPTPRAFELSRSITEALHQVRIALAIQAEEFDPATSPRSFRLAGVDYSDAGMMPDTVALIRREAPNVTAQTLQLSADEALARLDDGTIDMAIGSFPDAPKRMGMLLLREERLVCVIRIDHPALSGAWTAESFAALPHMVVRLSGGPSPDPVDAALGAVGLKRSVVLSVTNHMALPFVVRKSDLVACAGEGAARLYADIAGVAFRPPPIDLPPRRISMVWSRKTEDASGLKWLRQRIVAVARQHRERLGEARPVHR